MISLFDYNYHVNIIMELVVKVAIAQQLADAILAQPIAVCMHEHTDKTLGTFKVSDELHKPSDFMVSMLACSVSTFADNLAMQANDSLACF